MKARLNSAQRALVALIVVSLALAALAFPRGNNAAYSAALDELSAFDKGFKQVELERSLLAYAQAQGLVPLPDVARAITGPGVPNVSAAAQAQPIVPIAELSLRTLGDVHERSKHGSSIPIASTTAEPLGSAIAWRLARINPDGRYALVRIELEPTQLTAADVELEREVSKLRLETRTAELAALDAAKSLARAEEVFENKRKLRVTWKILLKFDELRKAAKASWNERQRIESDIRNRYERAAKRAQDTANRPIQPVAKAPEFAIARVTLEAAGAPSTTLQVPVTLKTQAAKLPILAGTSFSATKDAGLWEEVKDGNAATAIARTRDKFTWHNRYTEVAGLRFGGMTVLQALPALLPLLLLAFLSRMRHVSVSYNPFGTTVTDPLPRVGLHSRAVELLALVLLPLIAVALTIHALWAVAQLPIVPVVAGVAAIGLGIYAFVELGSLQNLVEAVVRSHSSYPPPGKQSNETPA
jgi:hypothetical protein